MDRVSALEGLLERIRKNAALPRPPRAAPATITARPPFSPPIPREEPELLDDALLESVPPPTVKPDGNERPEPTRRPYEEEETTLVRKMPIDLEALAAARAEEVAEDDSPPIEVDFDDLEIVGPNGA